MQLLPFQRQFDTENNCCCCCRYKYFRAQTTRSCIKLWYQTRVSSSLFSIDTDSCQSSLSEYPIEGETNVRKGSRTTTRTGQTIIKRKKETRQKSFILIFQTKPANRFASNPWGQSHTCTHSSNIRISPENSSQTNRQVGMRHRVPVIRDSPKSVRRTSANRLASTHWASSILTLRTRS